jgi:hypothetical protein
MVGEELSGFDKREEALKKPLSNIAAFGLKPIWHRLKRYF